MLTVISAKQNKQGSAIAECQVTNSETTLNAKLSSCKKNSQKQRLSKTSAAESTSSEKDYKPFWNEQCGEISSKLWLPTETDLQDSGLTLSASLSKKMVENSWFSARIHSRPNKNSRKTCSISFTSSPAECTDYAITKSRLVKLYPSKQQKVKFYYWLNVSRFTFNWTIDFIRTCVGWTPSWMDIKKCATQQLPAWTKECPFQIKGIAIKDAHQAFYKAKGDPKFRSRKNPTQTCFIPKTAIKPEGIYPKDSGKGLRYSEPLPESLMDSRLLWRAGKFYIALPQQTTRVPYGEN